MTDSQHAIPGACCAGVRCAGIIWIGLAVILQFTAAPATAFTGHALSLQGNGHVEVEDTPLLHGSRELTLSAWFRVDRLSGWQALMWKGDLPDRHPFSNREFGLFVEGSGYVHLCSTPVSRQRRGQLYVNTPGGTVHPGQWFHVAAVVSSQANGGVMRIFVNGELSASRPYDRSGLRDATGPLWLGGIPQTGAGFHGMIDDVRIWRRALGPDEIRQQMSGATVAASGLVAHYTFDAVDTGGAIVDQSGHGHRGHLIGDAHLRTLQVLLPPVVTAVPMASPVLATNGLPFGASTGTTTTTTTTMRGDESTTTTTTPVVPVTAVPMVFAPAIPVATAPVLVAEPIPAATERIEAGNITPKATASRWQPERYSGWTHKWSAQRPDAWRTQPEGLLARYNRVDGLVMGWRLPQRYNTYSGLAHFGELTYGFDAGTWRYQAGGELFTFYGPSHEGAHLAAVGAEVHDLTATQDDWLLSEEENSLAAALLRRDYFDHFRRRGGSLYSSHNVGGVLQFTGRYTHDRYKSLAQIADWSLFGDRWGDDSFTPNPQIDEGTIASLRLDVQLDTRDEPITPDRGWLINGMVERSGGFLEGDHTFKRYLIDLRRYQPTGRGARFDLRLRGATAKGVMPSQFRYQIGGLGSLRGYGDKAFEGDRVALINAQYWVDMDQHWRSSLPVDGIGVGVFFDAGAVWSARDLSDPFEGFENLRDEGDWKRSIGLSIGNGDGSIRLDFARPLDEDLDGQIGGWQMLARISRTF